MRARHLRNRLAALAAALLVAPLALAPTPAAAAPGEVTVTYVETSRWDSGYGGQITIQNETTSDLTDWTVSFDTPSGVQITSLWNAVHTVNGNTHTLTPPSWGAPVPANGSYQIGFNGTHGGGDTTPVNCTVNGSPCSGDPGEPDTEAPSTPGGLTVGEVTSNTVALSWDAATDNVGVAGYEIVSGGQVVRSVNGDTLTATVGGLEPLTEYSFTVRAYDTSNNRGADSAAVTATTLEGGGTTPTGERRVAYFTQWGIYDRGYLVRNLETSGTAANLTHINYAFGNINANGECFMANQLGQGDAWADYGRSFRADESVDGVADTWNQDLRGNFNQLRKLKEMYPDLKVNISLGGWTWSEHFSDAALTPESRQRMVSSCIDQFLRGNLPMFDGAGGPGAAAGIFDGIDLDWEWPGSAGHEHNTVRPEDRENFTALVQEFRTQLDALETETGQPYELTAFLPADPEKVEAGFQMGQLMPNFDFVTVQGYDYHGGWENATAHQSNLVFDQNDPSPRQFSSEIAIQEYVSRGVDPADMVLGLPFYSRGWTGVDPGPNGDGLFQSATGPAPGTYEQGIDDWKVIKDLPGFTLHRDETHGAAWLYDGNTFWTYDDEIALTQKTDWAQAQGLGGVMIWSIDGDDANGTLMNAVDAALAS
ncbi:glycoside hydrolase family 18 chitinase [Nocardiopsis sp. EMB25]|uniref:glycoside hydrolase family 18 chitinase n=2 Tax=Nocardiopsis TaxID=2013 RepID=UPI0022840084|nr:glycoside hydrolase family 18 chitinase [Nocardiopsis sp. EMB25]MCY9782314.1 glycoside hydrolase family 18 chitinase [Nocardiopsis sp. EMB25]